MQSLAELPRVWPGIFLPGFHHWGEDVPIPPTYAGFPLEWLPAIERELDDDLEWLLREPPVDEAIEGDVTEAALDALGTATFPLPAAFTSFFASDEPRKRLRSATDCYLRLPDFVAPFGEGRLINFLADSQSCVFWLLYSGPDGEAIVATEYPPGFEFSDAFAKRQQRDPGSLADDASVCADSFSEFLYRFWIENEIFFRHGSGLTDEQRRYGEQFATACGKACSSRSLRE